jgi:hypothetical protein
LGSQQFVKVDSEIADLHKLMKENPEAIKALSDNQELVQLLLDLITRTDSIESLKSGVKVLASENISALGNVVSMERLNRFIKVLENNIENADENFWQEVFKTNQWIIAQLFSCPYTIFANQAYLGGKGINNQGGNLCDFIYQNLITKNIALVEIKTPCTKLIGKRYRNNSFSLSEELTSSINQVLGYKDNIQKNYNALDKNSNENFVAFNPKCILIIGRTGGLRGIEISTLESFRNSIHAVEIVAFDELLMKIRGIREIIRE